MAKEKSITELKDEKKQLSTRSKTILETAKGEKGYSFRSHCQAQSPILSVQA